MATGGLNLLMIENNKNMILAYIRLSLKMLNEIYGRLHGNVSGY
jgi:hypothetical protein